MAGGCPTEAADGGEGGGLLALTDRVMGSQADVAWVTVGVPALGVLGCFGRRASRSGITGWLRWLTGGNWVRRGRWPAGAGSPAGGPGSRADVDRPAASVDVVAKSQADVAQAEVDSDSTMTDYYEVDGQLSNSATQSETADAAESRADVAPVDVRRLGGG